MQETVHTEVKRQPAHEHTHCTATFPVRPLRKGFHVPRLSVQAQACSHRRTAVRMRHLRSPVHPRFPAARAPANSHKRTTFQVRRVRPGVRSQRHDAQAPAESLQAEQGAGGCSEEPCGRQWGWVGCRYTRR